MIGLNRQAAAQKILNFMNSPSETKLDLSRLFLGSLPDIFDNNEMKNRLTDLRLGRNRLQSVPDSIANLANLTYLDLRDNRFQSLPDSIIQLPTQWEVNLEKLGLSNQDHNRIQPVFHSSDLKQPLTLKKNTNYSSYMNFSTFPLYFL